MEKAIVFAMTLAILGSPILLFLGGKLNVEPGLRFKLVIGLIFGLWCGMNKFSFDWEWAAGAFCISAVLLIGFMFWSVLCWGYTISMLLCFQMCSEIESLQQWEIAYAGPSGIKELTLNRLKVLTRLRFAKVEKHLSLTKLGHLNASIFKIICKIFGVTI